MVYHVLDVFFSRYSDPTGHGSIPMIPPTKLVKVSKEVWRSNFRRSNFRVTDFYKSQLPLSRYHTISPLSQHHRYRNITTVTISPLSRHHHYHNITTITRSPLSKHHNITTITISPQSQHNITSITISPLSQDHHYQNITTITITI